jgi:hypothetical protein
MVEIFGLSTGFGTGSRPAADEISKERLFTC